jgi:cyclopropane-fatty-acyl-phospholipid synthase
VIPIFERVYGKAQLAKWITYWRLFFIACSEFFKYNDGEEWFVSHYLFRKSA